MRNGAYWPGGSLPEIAPELLTDILTRAADIAILLDKSGQVMSVLINPNNRSFGRLDHWLGRDIREFLTSESVVKIDKRLAGDPGDAPLELNHSDNATWEFPIRYTLHRIAESGEILLLGRDLRPIAEVQLQLAKAQMALERDHESQREYDARYRVLLTATRDAIIFISLASGRVTDMNKTAGLLLGASRDALVGAPFAQEFEGGRRGEVMERLSNAVDSGPVELRARRSRRTLRATPTVFRAGGERLLLCRLEPAEASDLVADELSEHLSAMFQDGVDGLVFTDSDGVIKSANESFLTMVEAAEASAVKGRSLGDFLSRGGVDLKVLTENAARSGQMRLYSTQLAGEYGAEVPAEISATYLNDRLRPAFAFVIRDVSRADAVRRPAGGPMSEDAARNVVDLVGSTNLKQIVAETTEVVEKMCIETAVELTRNNRVAAAEMLGLSRQSLYVKLRKYGILERGEQN